MDAVLEFSRNNADGGLSQASSSKHVSSTFPTEPVYLAKPRLQARLGALAREISSIDESISELQRVKAELQREQRGVQSELNSLGSNLTLSISTRPSSPKGKDKATAGSSLIDYMEDFEWSGPLKAKMKEVFGIDSFRLCQQG